MPLYLSLYIFTPARVMFLLCHAVSCLMSHVSCLTSHVSCLMSRRLMRLMRLMS